MNFSIEIFRLEDFEDSMFDEYQRYNFHQILWFTECEGNNEYFINFNKLQVFKDQVVIIFPGQIDRIEATHKKGYLIAINNNVFYDINQKINSAYLNGNFSNIPVTLNESEKQTLETIMLLIINEYKSLNRSVLMETYVQSFLFHVSASLKDDTFFRQDSSDHLFILFVKLVDENFKIHREIDFYAEQLDITPAKLNNICKRVTGKTTKQYIQECLILEIKKEIVLGEKSLKEISFDLGFNEPAYFTRFFKQQTSISPTEFMKK